MACPQPLLAGNANAWVVKASNGARGENVTVLTNLQDILTECERLCWNCVVQKYLERPLLIPSKMEAAGVPADQNKFKLDLRVWVNVLDWNPLTVFVHKEPYFRVATRRYGLNASHQAPEPMAHVTNRREEENRVSLREVLERLGSTAPAKWNDRTWPRMLDAIRASLLVERDLILGRDWEQPRPRTFELIGYDFVIDEEWMPWLLEANLMPMMLDDCRVPELRRWVDEATETLLATTLRYFNGTLRLPNASELETSYNAVEHACGAERAFSEELLHHCHTDQFWCYGKDVLCIPPCLVRGLDVGHPCGPWLLVLREQELPVSTIWDRCASVWARWCSERPETNWWGVLQGFLIPELSLQHCTDWS